MDKQPHASKRVTLSDAMTAVSRRRFLGWLGRFAAALPFGRMSIHGHSAVTSTPHTALSPTQLMAQWVNQLHTVPPFSFTYRGQSSHLFLAHWPRTMTHRVLDTQRTEHVITWSAPGDGLVVRCVAIQYHDFPTVEWTLFFKNTGAQPLPPVGDLLACDIQVTRQPKHDLLLHTCNGSLAVLEDFGTHDIPLPTQGSIMLTCESGRPTCGIVRRDPHLIEGGFPYYNIDWGGHGVIAAIGWPGQWAAEMARDGAGGVSLRAGMSTLNHTDLPTNAHITDTGLAEISLQPHEEIRTPLVVLQFWQESDWIAAQNVWRRWMVAHNMPHPGGQPPAPMCPAQAGDISLTTTASFHLSEIAAYGADHLTSTTGGTYDHWWIDAGWYVTPPNAADWSVVGTWQADPPRYPHGLRPVTDAARALGMKSIIWHEPERVQPNTWLFNNRPQWLLGPGPDGDARLLNLGNPQAWQWVVQHFDGLIRTNGIDVFRQDFNIEPLAYWNMADVPGRRGITQIRHVTGFLAFWDELLRRHPHLLIDTCASGGRRLDVETLRRSVPLWRSDDQGDALTEQCHSYGLSLWIPYHGSGVSPDTAYTLRSAMIPSFMVFLKPDFASDATLALARRMTHEWHSFAADLLGDYYPLTPYSTFDDVWLAWQFQRPETGSGVVQAFRRDQSSLSSLRLKLRGLQPQAMYAVHNTDEPVTRHVTGHYLMTTGLFVQLAQAPAAATITYRRMAAS